MSSIMRRVSRVFSGWCVRSTEGGLDKSNDLLPVYDDMYVGDGYKPIRGLGIGRILQGGDVIGMQGRIVSRGPTEGGGLLLEGYVGDTRDIDIEPNAPVEISGNPIFLMSTAGYFLEVGQELTEDRYLGLGATTTLESGRIVAPLIIGPEIIYANSQAAESSLDVQIPADGTVTNLVSMVLTDDYPADVASAQFRALCAELGDRETLFSLQIWVNGVKGLTFPQFAVTGNQNLVVYGQVLSQQANTGETIELRVSCTGTQQLSDPWVLGATAPTRIEFRK